jgi:hypothetical protein
MSEINRERISLMVECEDCKHKFEIASGEAAHSITHKKEFNVNGQSIFLTYYDCPKCGRRHYVQIDDATSLNKLKEVSRQFVKLAVLKKKDKEIPQKQSAKFKKARQNLSDYRMNLMKEYTDKLLHNNETDSDFVLRFSV